MGTPLYVTLWFCIAAWKILSLSLTFGISIIMCFCVVLFGSNLTGTLYASRTCMFISFVKLGKFPFIIFSCRYSISCSFFSPSGTPGMYLLLDLLKLSQRLLILSSFFNVFLLVVLIFFFFLMFQIIDLILGFIHSTVVSL